MLIKRQGDKQKKSGSVLRMNEQVYYNIALSLLLTNTIFA